MHWEVSLVHSLQGYSANLDVDLAVAELVEQIGSEGAVGLLYFASDDYDEHFLARSISSKFHCPVWGCCAAGVFGARGYHPQGIQAISLSGPLTIKPFYCKSLDDIDSILSVADGVGHAGRNAFAVLLLDGLSQKEEEFVHQLYLRIGNIPLIGGSSGGNLDFLKTWLASGDQVHSGGALVLLVESQIPFRVVKFESSLPTPVRFLVTSADPEQRLVFEVNGKRAVDEYARLIGVKTLQASDLARFPWVLELGGQRYLRAVRESRADGSLVLHCGIEEGTILSIGRAQDSISVARQAFEAVAKELGSVGLLLGFDCVLRRLELEHQGLLPEMGELMKQYHVAGFNTFGEQFDSVHMNQTFTGLALGGFP